MIAPAARSRATTIIVCRRDEVGIKRRAKGRAQPGDVVEILDRDGQALQRPCFATREPIIALTGRAPRSIEAADRESVQKRIERLDPFQAIFEQRAWSEVAGTQAQRQF